MAHARCSRRADVIFCRRSKDFKLLQGATSHATDHCTSLFNDRARREFLIMFNNRSISCVGKNDL